MKHLLSFLAGVFVLVGLLVGGRYMLEYRQGYTSDKIISLYNWGDYIDPDILVDFEEETGYRVIYETFDSNEAMLAKIEQGGNQYDLAIPSEYMIETMIEKDLIMPLDHDRLPNLKNIDPKFLHQPFDPDNKYSIPYFWGTLGIIYNSKYVEAEEVDRWNDLWDPKFNNSILIYDGAREVMGIGLQSLGYSLNETDSSRLAEAAEKMKKLMPNIQALIADEIKLHLLNEEAILGITFSGEAAMAIEENPDLQYILPEEGSNLWFDNMVIPKNAANPQGAYDLMNYMLRPDVAAKNAEYIGYSTPNKEAMALMDPEITSDKAFYPDDEMISQLEVYRNLGQEKLIEYNDYFLKIKIEPGQ